MLQCFVRRLAVKRAFCCIAKAADTDEMMMVNSLSRGKLMSDLVGES